MTEFELIRRYFESQPVKRADVALGIGDDGAVLDVPVGEQLVVTSDTLVEGVHFFRDVNPSALGHKALAVNLSDLAAMGAAPAWFTLSLTLPSADETWLEQFCRGLYALAGRFGVQLVGGDTTRGMLSVTITAGGYVPQGSALTRSGARPGDGIYVTGTLGSAAGAVRCRLGTLTLPSGDLNEFATRLDWPEPRVTVGQALRGIASAAIDVSDGILADLGHIARSSGVGARLFLGLLPLAGAYRRQKELIGWEPALTGGDDYELCFTAPTSKGAMVRQVLSVLSIDVTRVGEIIDGAGVEVRDEQGHVAHNERPGYDHFAETGRR